MNKYVAVLILMLMIVGCATSKVEQKTIDLDRSRPHLVITLVYNFEVYEKPAFFLPKSYPTYAILLKEKST